jgi:hypothetical protein
MRKLFVGAVLALALPVAAAQADDSAAVSAKTLAKQACKTEKAQMGTKTFKLTYAVKSVAKATDKCVAKTVPATTAAKENAAQTCSAERDLDPAAFAGKYGTNGKEGTAGFGKNAFGKCVSTLAKQQSQEETEDRVDAAETCKGLDKATFEATYGPKKNAFGKCVSATAKANADDDETETETETGTQS